MRRCGAPVLKEFWLKFLHLEPYTAFRAVRRWAESHRLPTHPRFDHERYRVRIGPELRTFLLERGHPETLVDEFFTRF